MRNRLHLLRDKLEAKPCLILIVFLLISVGEAGNTILSMGSGASKEGEKPKANDLLKATFKRVPGRAYGGAALDTGEPGSWYSHYVGSPTVDFDGHLNRLWFVGGAKTTDPGVPYDAYERVGLAESRDGINWKLANGGNPVLDLGPPGSFDSKGVSHPYVLRVNKKYMMWYGGIDGKQAKDLGLKPAHVRIERIGLAISSDGIHWNRANQGKPVLDIGPKDSIDSIQATGMHVLQIGGRFVMWYGAYNGLHTLAMATSSDGIYWEKANGGKALTGLLGPEQLGPSVYFDGQAYFMLYDRNLNRYWATYAASSSDGIHWQPAFDGKPVLGPPPAGSFGTAGPGETIQSIPHRFLFKVVEPAYGMELRMALRRITAGLDSWSQPYRSSASSRSSFLQEVR